MNAKSAQDGITASQINFQLTCQQPAAASLFQSRPADQPTRLGLVILGCR
jgi:hypothetical protein